GWGAWVRGGGAAPGKGVVRPAATIDRMESPSVGRNTQPQEVMMRLLSPALLVTLALAAPVLAETPTSPASIIDAYAIEQTETVTATVKAIDVKTRHATLLLPDGKKQTFAVDPQVRNLDEVKRGDQVVVQYKNALEVELSKPDPTQPLPLPTEAIAVDHRAAEGGKPEGTVART